MTIWTLDIYVFLSFMLWSLTWPRNEWMSNTFIVLGSTILALWYQPALSEILGGKEVNGVTFPFHRLLGIFLFISLLWSFLEQWEELKIWYKSRKELT